MMRAPGMMMRRAGMHPYCRGRMRRGYIYSPVLMHSSCNYLMHLNQIHPASSWLILFRCIHPAFNLCIRIGSSCIESHPMNSSCMEIGMIFVSSIVLLFHVSFVFRIGMIPCNVRFGRVLGRLNPPGLNRRYVRFHMSGPCCARSSPSLPKTPSTSIPSEIRSRTLTSSTGEDSMPS